MAAKTATKRAKAKYVLVRTYSAGVHCGELSERKGMDVILKEARRIWSWGGAFTLNEIAMSGIKTGKVSVEVPEIVLTQAIEIIPFAKEGEACLRRFQSHKVRVQTRRVQRQATGEMGVAVQRRIVQRARRSYQGSNR